MNKEHVFAGLVGEREREKIPPGPHWDLGSTPYSECEAVFPQRPVASEMILGHESTELKGKPSPRGQVSSFSWEL